MTIKNPTPEDVASLRLLWKEAFGDTDAFLDKFFGVGFSANRCRLLSVDGQLAAVLYWFDCSWNEEKVAYLYAVATAKDKQGNGLCRTLMTDTHKHLKALGYAGAALVPGNEGLFSLYGKFGYQPFCPMDTVTIAPGKTPLGVQSIDPTTYGQLRRQYLPEDSLLQEGVTLDFLATFGSFYNSNGSLFSLYKEQDALYFQEFFGDPESLPGIAAELGATSATVRLPGKKPYAMYLDFENPERIPSYLGISLN